MQHPRIVVVGEGMVEAIPVAGDGLRLGYGGDTLNTAIHLARLGLDVSFVTALGQDPFSLKLRGAWQAEGLGLDHVLTDPLRLPGLYAIQTDDQGERSFHYWRETSAARRMFELPGADQALEAIRTSDLVVFSLITLAILPDAGRRALLDACKASTGRVAFDGNYRARLWSGPQAARDARDAALRVSDIGLPTLEDELALEDAPLQPAPGQGHGDIATRAQAVEAAWRAGGVAETIVKLGADGCRLPDGSMAPPPRRIRPVDTSGAGDAFNAAYLAARLRGRPPRSAAQDGHRLAAWVIGRPGAVPPIDAEAPYGARGVEAGEIPGDGRPA